YNLLKIIQKYIKRGVGKLDDNLMDLINVGNFTKIAVKRFEENIVNKTNYIESVRRERLGEKSSFKEEK
ncbi:hypothetical protein, partial [Clostridium sp.]|uniref:hypothetical protein n=1 Tax=Clostridium sp. TaxID=1506 RepID=UPI00290A6592